MLRTRLSLFNYTNLYQSSRLNPNGFNLDFGRLVRLTIAFLLGRSVVTMRLRVR